MFGQLSVGVRRTASPRKSRGHTGRTRGSGFGPSPRARRRWGGRPGGVPVPGSSFPKCGGGPRPCERAASVSSRAQVSGVTFEAALDAELRVRRFRGPETRVLGPGGIRYSQTPRSETRKKTRPGLRRRSSEKSGAKAV